MLTPDFDAFARAYEAGAAGVLRATLVGDLITPVAAFLKLRHGGPGRRSCSNPSRGARCGAAIR
jgi:hypothetical protein